MSPAINNITPGDGIYVAWIDFDETCRWEYFGVEHTHESDTGWLTVTISNDDHAFRLVQTPAGPFMLLDQLVGPIDVSQSVRIGVGVAPSADRLVWETLLTLLELGYDPADAMDVVALGYGHASSSVYHKLRGKSRDDLGARVDEIVADLASAGQNSER